MIPALYAHMNNERKKKETTIWQSSRTRKKTMNILKFSYNKSFDYMRCLLENT
jgi:hypothetical protein